MAQALEHVCSHVQGLHVHVHTRAVGTLRRFLAAQSQLKSWFHPRRRRSQILGVPTQGLTQGRA